MNMMKMPGWLETLVIKALNTYVDAEVIRAAFEGWKAEFAAWLKVQVAITTNKIDDKIADSVIAALNGCTPDTAFLCDLIKRGEVAALDLLRKLAKGTETGIDDAMVDILADALGVEG